MGKTSSKAAAANGQAEREQRELACVLSEAEHGQRADTMARCELDIEVLEQQRRGVNGQIADLRAERARLAKIIDEREERRMVECSWIEDFSTKSYKLVRQDTGETVDVRPMTAKDLQGTLNVDGPNDGDSDDGSDDDDDDDGDSDDSAAVMRTELVTTPPVNIGELPAKRKRKSSKPRASNSSSKRNSNTRHIHI